jgi:hypothetical protein
MKRMLSATVLALLMVVCRPPVAWAADPPYASEPSCLRAESPEVCAKWFKPPAKPKPVSLSLDACTAMLYEATRYMESAVILLRLDLMQESRTDHARALSMVRAAADCSENSKPATQQQRSAWGQQQDEFMGHAHVLEASLAAHANNP